jgi:hypothetical protein
MFKKYQNESQMDRVIRFVLGIIIGIIGYYFTSGVTQIVLYVVAFISLLTSITGFCLIYKILGIDTRKKSTI